LCAQAELRSPSQWCPATAPRGPALTAIFNIGYLLLMLAAVAAMFAHALVGGGC